jgi:hypothetical protein
MIDDGRPRSQAVLANARRRPDIAGDAGAISCRPLIALRPQSGHSIREDTMSLRNVGSGRLSRLAVVPVVASLVMFTGASLSAQSQYGPPQPISTSVARTYASPGPDLMTREMNRAADEHFRRNTPRVSTYSVRSSSRPSRHVGYGELTLRCSANRYAAVVDWGQPMDFSAPVTWQFDTEEPYAAVMRRDGDKDGRMLIETPRRLAERLQDASVLVLQATSMRGDRVTHLFRVNDLTVSRIGQSLRSGC